MCHQSVGLIARELEAHGISTVCLSSAESITAAVNPPRAVYVDYPLGHTAGKPDDKAGQRRILLAALRALETAQQPGLIIDSGERWSNDDGWKDRVMRPAPADDADSADDGHEDDRVERFDTPQYQCDADAAAVSAECPSCIWLERAY